jgi:hypothetical protein
MLHLRENRVCSYRTVVLHLGEKPSLWLSINCVEAQDSSKTDLIGEIGMVRKRPYTTPHDSAHWTSGALRRSLPDGSTPFPFRLPRNRELAHTILSSYFDHLNPHRPVFIQSEFMVQINALYRAIDRVEAGAPPSPPNPNVPAGWETANDAGFLCAVYLVFALGTMVVRNRRLHAMTSRPDDLPWPSHEEFFDLAWRLKPELANSISTLQALILLHWYLYCEVSRAFLAFQLIAN